MGPQSGTSPWRGSGARARCGWTAHPAAPGGGTGLLAVHSLHLPRRSFGRGLGQVAGLFLPEGFPSVGSVSVKFPALPPGSHLSPQGEAHPRR